MNTADLPGLSGFLVDVPEEMVCRLRGHHVACVAAGSIRIFNALSISGGFRE